jgi:hypothetical protein
MARHTGSPAVTKNPQIATKKTEFKQNDLMQFS